MSAAGLPQLDQECEPLTHYELLQRMREQGTTIPSIFSIPGLLSSCFRVDWLHTADLGVSQDYLGGLFQVLLGKIAPGRCAQDQCSALFLRMQQYYRMYPEITSKLDNLTLLMIRKCATKPPKLRSRAGECRGLIYFGKLMAEEFLDPRNPYEQAIIIAGQELWECYRQLSAAEYTAVALRTHGLQFRAQMAALDIHTRSVEFRVKPKMHLFLHVTSGKMGNPSSFWNYRDEDFGGSIADMFFRAGGPSTAQAGSRSLLEKFVAQSRMPWIGVE